MSFPTEIPNSQPSSPGVASSSDEAEAASDATTLQPNSTSNVDSADSPDHVESEASQHSDSMKRSEKPLPQSTQIPIKSVSSDLPQNPIAKTPHKLLSTNLSSTNSSRRRAKPSATYSAEYLHQRIDVLQSSLASTHAQLTSSLAELEPLVTQKSDKQSSEESWASTYGSATARNHQQPQYTLDAQETTTLRSAEAILQAHVKQLGKYNAIKDIAMSILGIIAEKEGRTLMEVMVDRGVAEDD